MVFIRLNLSAFLITLIACLITAESLQAVENDPTVITLMVVYTENAKNWADEHQGGINNVIAQGVAHTNQALMNSEISVEIQLVHAAMVKYAETDNSILDLRRLTADRNGAPYGEEYAGFMVEVHDLRDQYNADLVKLITKNRDFGGYAWIATIPRPEYGFSTTTVRSASGFTFTHEIGHNLGFAHSKNQTSSPASATGGMFEYSTGWRWNGNDGRGYASVMTYSEGDIRIPQYSNPDINYKGVPTGSYSGQYAPADNARSLMKTRNLIAAYKGSPANVQDSLAVVSLYHKLGGHQWKNLSNWLSNQPLTQWNGISSLDNVVLINLSDNNLNGTLPNDVFNLEKIMHLDLSDNNIFGELNSEIGSLRLLKSLYLNGNNFDGKIPKELGNLSNLNYLNLLENDLTGPIPTELGNLTNLRILWIQNNDLRGPIPVNFKNLKNLEWFYFNNNNLCIPSDQEFLNWFNRVQTGDGLQNIKCEDVIPANIANLFPDNNSNNHSIRIVLEWSESKKADSYHIQVFDNENLYSPMIEYNGIESNSFLVTDLNQNTTYYWRVRAVNDYLESDWTEVWSFSTKTITEFKVFPNYPNPFNALTTIQYQLPQESHVVIDLFNVLGQRINVLVDLQQQDGVYKIQFDGSNYASGLYFLRFQTEQFTEIQTLTLIK